MLYCQFDRLFIFVEAFLCNVLEIICEMCQLRRDVFNIGIKFLMASEHGRRSVLHQLQKGVTVALRFSF